MNKNCAIMFQRINTVIACVTLVVVIAGLPADAVAATTYRETGLPTSGLCSKPLSAGGRGCSCTTQTCVGCSWTPIQCIRTVSGAGAYLLKVGVRVPDGVAAPEVIATNHADIWPLELNGTEVYFSQTCGVGCDVDSLPAPPGYHWVQYQSTSLITPPAGPDSVTFGIAVRWTQAPPRRTTLALWLSDDSDDRYGEPVTDMLVKFTYARPVPRSTGQKRWFFAQITPNPFNPATTISYTVGESGWVELTVFGVDGSLTRRLVRQTQSTGEYQVVWDGTDDVGQLAASGVYFCNLRASGFESTQKLILLK